jgi:hypothetical protein
MSHTDHLTMIKYLRQLDGSVLENFVAETVRTLNYTRKDDQSDQENATIKYDDAVNRALYRKCVKQLKETAEPIIIYANYRKLFNRTLKKTYKEQVKKKRDY